MALNYPGPYELRVNYVVNAEPVNVRNHQLRLSCQMAVTGNPGDPFNLWTPIQKDGGTIVTLANHLNALIGVIDDCFHNTTDFVNAELWQYTPGTFDAIYRSASAIATSGVSSTATAQLSQTIWTFRSQLGGIMRVDLRGTIFTPGAFVSIPTTGVQQAVATYFLGGTSPWWARDNSYPLAGLKVLPGQNEHAFKEVNR